MTIATASHALRTGSEQSRSPHCELLKPRTSPPGFPPPLMLLLLLRCTAPASPPGGGGGCARSNACATMPVGGGSSADFTSCDPGHQATNQPLPTVAWMLVPSSRVSVTPVTSVPVRPSASEYAWAARSVACEIDSRMCPAGTSTG